MLDAVVATPFDVLDGVFASKGAAFVPQTDRDWTPVLNARKRDPIVLANLARRWNLRYNPTKATVGPVAIPFDSLFPSRSRMLDRYRTTFPPDIRAKALSKRGIVLRVQELFALARLDASRCHWYFRDRLILARVDPNRLEDALPLLSTALGGKYDVKRKSIEFDPGTFRDVFRATLNSLRRPADRSIDLARLTVDDATDSALIDLYRTSEPKIVEVPLIGGKVNAVLTDYIQARAKEIGAAGTEPAFLRDLDPKVPPKIYYNPLNGASAYVTQTGNRASVF